MLYHQPGEFLAAAVWFGMVTWLMVRTRNIWDCVAAHAVTNVLLGIYVVTWSSGRCGNRPLGIRTFTCMRSNSLCTIACRWRRSSR